MRRQVVGVAVAMLVGVGVARADESKVKEQANALVVAGNELARKGEYAPAIAKFKEAYAIKPWALLHCNIGLSYYRLTLYAQSHLFLTQCRARWDADEKRPLESWVNEKINDSLARMREGSFTPVRIAVEPADASVRVSSFAADESFVGGRILWLPQGAQRLRVSREGYETVERAIKLDAKDELELSVALSPQASAGTASSAGPTSTSTRAGVQPVDVREPPSQRSATPFVVLGLGVAGLAGGGIMHAVAASTRSEAEELPAGSAFDDKNASFETQRNIAYALYGVGAVGVLLGTYLFLSDSSGDDEKAQLGLQLSEEETELTVRWSF